MGGHEKTQYFVYSPNCDYNRKDYLGTHTRKQRRDMKKDLKAKSTQNVEKAKKSISLMEIKRSSTFKDFFKFLK